MADHHSQLLASLRAAVDAAPEDPVLRLHLAELLLDGGDAEQAIGHLATVLQLDPRAARAQELMGRALSTPVTAAPPAQDAEAAGAASQPDRPEPPDPAELRDAVSGAPAPPHEAGLPADPELPPGIEADEAAAMREEDFPLTRERVRLADVAGMHDVKRRLEAAFLAPMRNSDLRQAFAKSLRGGLLLYGPPGCGKTFIASAVSGELGARFLSVSLADVLDRWIGNSERNLQALFRQARQYRPCVVFLDEIDAIGGRRANVSAGMRNVVTQLLTELDSGEESNDGVFLLAATNHPWDVDTALRRPGRLDRMLFVPPPDADARAVILRSGLADRPAEQVDISRLVRRTAGFSGADLAHLCDSAAENALLESAALGRVRPIATADFDAALAEVRPSTGPWFESARNVVAFANADGSYRELEVYMREHRI